MIGLSEPPASRGGLPGLMHLPQEDGEGNAAPGLAGRILIVEDDYLVGLSSEWALSDAGFEVLSVVTTGEAAIEQVARDRPDLVLMDIRLAGKMDGVQAALALRAQGVRCLFASANSDPGTVTRTQEADPIGWLRKPFTGAALVAAVQDALARLREG